MTTVAEGELAVAMDQLMRLVDVMRRSDPDYCEAHGEEPVDDEEWDEALEEAEEYAEELAELLLKGYAHD